MRWKDAVRGLVHRGAHSAEETFDGLVARVRARTGRTDRVVIQSYRGYGTAEELWVMGRVLEDEGLRTSTDRDTLWQNVVAMYRRFESDEVPGIEVEVALRDERVRVTTDDEGYFEARLRPEHPRTPSAGWEDLDVRLVGPVEAAEGVARVRVPHPDSAYGVITDVDDTILQSGATSLVTLARNTFLHNSRTRLPFEGVGAFYRALSRGPSGETDVTNPFFYVSSSPWNLYDFLDDFFDLNDLPAGPILLRDLGIDAEKLIKSGHDHKLRKIERILETYPKLPFVLVGDSGQEDPELYARAVQDHPGRIRAIYIRDVSADRRDQEVRELVEIVAGRGVELRLVSDSAQAAEHAASIGLISPQAVDAIVRETREDEGTPVGEPVPD